MSKNDPKPKVVTTLRSLNENEESVIINALELYCHEHPSRCGDAMSLLDNDAEFVRGLFWSPKSGY